MSDSNCGNIQILLDHWSCSAVMLAQYSLCSEGQRGSGSTGMSLSDTVNLQKLDLDES